MNQFYLTALQLALCLAPMAMGIYISMKVFNIPDITTDGSYTLAASVTAVLLSAHYPLWSTVLLSMLAGALAGMCTGFIHTTLRIDALLAGILVMTGLYSINLIVLGRSNVPLININDLFNISPFISQNVSGKILLTTMIVVLLLGGLTYLLKSDFGIAMRATGNNSSMAASMGINRNRMKIIGLAISNSLTGLSGFLICQYQGFADISMGIGIVITGMGSVLMAEAIRKAIGINSISGQLLLVVAGAFAFQWVLALTLSLGVDPNLLKLCTSFFVLLIVAMSALASKRNKS